MKAFTFQAPANILFEAGASRKLAELVSEYGAKRVLLVTDRGVRNAGLTANAEAALVSGGYGLTVFDDVKADPPSHVIERAVALCRDKGIELVASIGGGSALDTAKLVAYLAKTPDRLDDIYGVGLAKGERLPLLLVPTTAGTGSEVTPIAIVTTPTTEKKGVVAPRLLPDWAILDPELTLGLPAHVTAATGIDAMVHAIEAYTSKHKKNPMSDQLARQALTLLSANVRTVCADGSNLEARSQMLLGLDAGRNGIRQFTGRRGSCASLSDRRDIPRTPWFVECPGPDAGAALQFAGSGRALRRACADRRSQVAGNERQPSGRGSLSMRSRRSAGIVMCPHRWRTWALQGVT